MGVQPIDDGKAQKTYFGEEFGPGKGFIPVLVVLENKTNESLIFDKSKISYGPSGSVTSGPGTPDVSSKAGKKMNYASIAAGGSIVFGMIAARQKSNALKIQETLLKREIQSKTLSPGASVQGFLYLQVGKSVPREKISLQVPVTRSGTDDSISIDVIF